LELALQRDLPSLRDFYKSLSGLLAAGSVVVSDVAVRCATSKSSRLTMSCFILDGASRRTESFLGPLIISTPRITSKASSFARVDPARPPA
jgi:hypothetical protein